MEKATKFKNARIIALDAGTFVGSVERLILDLESRTVAGILLEGGTQAIDGEELQSLGEDAVTISTASTIIELNQATDLAECIKGEDEVYKKEVFTVAGKKIGFITDVLIDASSRSIVGFDMFSEFLFKDDVHGVVLLNEQVIFGRDLVLVPADVERLIANAQVNVERLKSTPGLSVVPPTPAYQTPQASAVRQQTFVPQQEMQAQAGIQAQPGVPVAQPEFSPQPPVAPIAQPEFSPQPPVAPIAQPEFSPQPPVAPIAQPEFSPQPPVAPISQSEFSSQPPVAPIPQVPVGEQPGAERPVPIQIEEPQSIDFSGVEAPKPEVIHGPSSPQSADDGTERPDMVQLFQNFPISNEASAEPVPELFPNQPQKEPSSDPLPSPAEQGPPVTLFPDEGLIGEPLGGGAEPAAVEPPKPTGKPSPKDKLIGFVLGKTSSRDVVDVDGNVILSAGDEITEEVIAAAQAAELMPQVFLAASQGLHSRFKRRR